jgi:hypothetical protein
VSGDRALGGGGMFGSERDEVTGDGRKLHNEELYKILE